MQDKEYQGPNKSNKSNKRRSAAKNDAPTAVHNPADRAPLSKEPHDVAVQGVKISRGIYSCSAMARKLIYVCIAKITESEPLLWKPEYFEPESWKECYRGVTRYKVPVARFKLSEAVRLLGMTRCRENYRLIKRAVEELFSAHIVIRDDEDGFLKANWFSSSHYNEKKNLVEMEFTPAIGWAAMEWKHRAFTRSRLETVGKFKSFYAMRLYDLALSWQGMKGKGKNPRGEWYFDMTVEELRKMFGIEPEAYKGKDGRSRMGEFIRKVVREPVEEINRVCDEFEVQWWKRHEGRRTYGFRFGCRMRAAQVAIAREDSAETKAEKRGVNAEELENESLKRDHAERLAQLFAEEKASPKNSLLKKIDSDVFIEA